MNYVPPFRLGRVLSPRTLAERQAIEAACYAAVERAICPPRQAPVLRVVR